MNAATREHADARGWLKQWAIAVQASDWPSIDELRRSYPSADGVKTEIGTTVTVFNVKGNAYRLLTCVNYVMRTVEVIELLTHAEYSKNWWKSRY